MVKLYHGNNKNNNWPFYYQSTFSLYHTYSALKKILLQYCKHKFYNTVLHHIVNLTVTGKLILHCNLNYCSKVPKFLLDPLNILKLLLFELPDKLTSTFPVPNYSYSSHSYSALPLT